MAEVGLVLTCVNCRHAWATMSFDDYLDRAPRWDLISGTGYYMQSFCPTCLKVVVDCPEAMNEPEGHRLLQDEGGVRCECGHLYSPFRTHLLRGVTIDWETINRDRLGHHAEVYKGEEQAAEFDRRLEEGEPVTVKRRKS